MLTRIPYGVLLCVLLLAIGCTPEAEVTSAEGVRPIYANGDELNIQVEAPREYDELSQIVYAHPYILIGELYQGIHVIDNTVPANPKKLMFIRIPGSTSFTIGDGVIYSSSGSDLVTIEYDDNTVQERSRIEAYFGGFDAFDQEAPTNYSGFFECVDLEKGVVIGWVEATLDSPECRTF